MEKVDCLCEYPGGSTMIKIIIAITFQHEINTVLDSYELD